MFASTVVPVVPGRQQSVSPLPHTAAVVFCASAVLSANTVEV